jgi:hypothetical protein
VIHSNRMSTSTTTIANTTTPTYQSVSEDYRQAMIDAYSTDMPDGPTQEVIETADFAVHVADDTIRPYAEGLEAKIAALQKENAALKAQATRVAVAVPVASAARAVAATNAYNARVHNGYQCFVQWMKEHPDPSLGELGKANGDWSRAVGALWKEKTKADQEQFFLDHRALVWPNIDFNTKSVGTQNKSSYTFFQQSLKGQKLSSREIADRWNAMSDDEKKPFVELAAAAKRGGIAVPAPAAVPVARPAVKAAPVAVVAGAATAPAAPATGSKPGKTPFTLYQQDNKGSGKSQTQIGADWKNLTAAQKKVYADRLAETQKVVA